MTAARVKGSSAADEARITRARPLLGTFVRIEAAFASQAGAEAGVAAAFDAVAHVHAAMSFHDPSSELSALHLAEDGAANAASDALLSVLRLALDVAQASDGAFDPVVAAFQAVKAGALPRPPGRAAEETASWRDVEVGPGHVRLRRPLWIDLGGVAKGWAVDAAVAALQAAGARSGWVDAGGDLRAFGRPLPVLLDARAPQAPTPRLDLADAALASSGGLAPDGRSAAQSHVDGRDGRALGTAFAAVVASDCATADALTKVVLALGKAAGPVLDRYGAHGYHLAAGADWSMLGGEEAG